MQLGTVRCTTMQCSAVQYRMNEGMEEGMTSAVGYLPISLVSLLYMVVWFASPI